MINQAIEWYPYTEDCKPDADEEVMVFAKNTLYYAVFSEGSIEYDYPETFAPTGLPVVNSVEFWARIPQPIASPKNRT